MIYPRHLADCVIGNIVRVVEIAGGMVRDAHGFAVSEKGTKENLVTTADIETEVFLKKELTSLIPGSAFVGEEGDEGRLSDEGYTWIVDPIDGTANFSRNIPMCAVSVALFRDGQPHIGVVFNPFTGTMFTAETGKGAYRNGERMRVSNRPVSNSLFCTAWCSYRKELSPACFRISERMHPLCMDIRRLGTAAYELCLLADGSVDLYFEMNLSPWDYAAALICVQEAGGCFYGIDGPVSFSEPGPVVAANNAGNLDFLLGVVREETNRI